MADINNKSQTTGYTSICGSRMPYGSTLNNRKTRECKLLWARFI